MGSETEVTIPVIDFTKENLNPGTDLWVKTCKEVRYALEEIGCFEAIYDKVPTQLQNSTFSALKDLFDLPLATKKQKTSDKLFHGYVGQAPFIPLYETLAIDNPTTLEGVKYFTNIMWPAGNNNFCETMYSYAKQVEELSKMATKMVFESYGVERLYEAQMAMTSYLLRFFNYRRPEANESDLGLHPHIDSTFISVVHQSEVEGLQIKTKDGSWIDFKSSLPSAFVVLAGDIITAWSNGRVRGCEHQVIMKQDKDRYSLGLFCFINGVIEVPEELVDEKHPLQYKGIDNFEYLLFTKRKGKISGKYIEAFCGV
ncbi:hypothetical protein UlMin_017446 [Ulmus minor]